ncbi:MAG: UDP-4-amino-4,6-dideoxy-N-acetyl-beta-L-altrosamine transaminase [Rhizomicrobium sp.]
MSAAPFLPYGRQCIEEDDIAAVAAVLRGDYLTTGPMVEAFETALASTVGARHAVVCSNGTTALYMAGRALGLKPGDTVIVPTVTFLATASAPHLCGAEIVFADVDPDTGLMRPEDLQDALQRAEGPVRALFNVHLTGQCGDLEGIANVARAAGLKIVDDACHAIGTRYTAHDGSRHTIGDQAFCDMTAYSFHPVKTVTTGEGGAVSTNDDGLAHALYLARNHGLTRDPAQFVQMGDALAADGTPNPWYYELIAPEFNFRATDFQCALGLSQLAKLDRFVKRRKELAARYDQNLSALAPKLKRLSGNPACDPARHLYVALIDFAAAGCDRAAFMAKLRDKGIGSQVHYFPVHRQPYYAKRYGAQHLPGADRYYARALSLPFYPTLTDADADRVCSALQDLLG